MNKEEAATLFSAKDVVNNTKIQILNVSFFPIVQIKIV